ncbi:MAG: molybdopterin molybdotransferase MoeA [Candidatus Eremiobacteraeota bacterium]|nr:molybdopterin molybdotransferase MoeA [Candidatus Eremiobacteraeota bacterium]
MKELFTVLAPSDAFRALAAHCVPGEGEELISLDAGLGRVLAAAIVARETLPAFARATMDGYAVRSVDTHGVSDASPAYLRLVGDVPTGVVPTRRVGSREAVRIHTGAMLPPGADAIVIVEDTNLHGDEVEVLATAALGENVLAVGEDIAAGDIAVPAGRRLRAADLGGLAALGVTLLRVRARPRIALLSTGDEVVPASGAPRGAQVRDVNASTVAATIARAGGAVLSAGIVADDERALREAAEDALARADALVISAGSSVSMRDLTAQVVDALGSPGVLVHGIAIKPGKPTVLAMCGGKPVVGLPGNPASALVVAWRIVRPLVRLLGGERARDLEASEQEAAAILDVAIPSRPGREEYVPCALSTDADGEVHARPIFGASNLIFTLVRADGLVAVPLDRSGVAAGERVRVVVP